MTNPYPSALWLPEAERYVALRWSVIVVHNPTGNPDLPCSCRRADCSKPAKHPRTAHGQHDATTDPEQIWAWAHEFPFSNLGLVLSPSGLVTASPDSPEWAAEFERRGLPAGPRFSSGGGEGHWHHLMRLPEGGPVHRLCRPDEYDILSNGLVIAPPSLHVSGRRYAWVEELARNPELPTAPEWLIQMLHEGVHATMTAEKEWLARRKREVATISEGERQRDLSALDYYSGRRWKTKSG